MNDENKMLEEIADLLKRYGYSMGSRKAIGGYDLFIRLTSIDESPPALGVHVTDGVWTKEKIGG